MQALWKEIYHWPEMPTDGRQWDTLFVEGDTFAIGELSARVLHSPGHTLASITYVIGDAAFVHDTLFQPDLGRRAPIFPVGMPKSLWNSIQQILTLPGDTAVHRPRLYARWP